MDGKLPLTAAPSWRNWRAKQEGAERLSVIELKLYTNAWFIAEARDHGPYSLLNGVCLLGGDAFELRPALVLRCEDYLPVELPNMKVTSDSHYHGGWLADEIAALVSLIFGVRIAAGPIDREFRPDEDPFGQPRSHSMSRLPALQPAMRSPQIPSIFKQQDLREIGLLDKLPAYSCGTAVALIKSARLYQQAIWVSDVSPETSWLLLVSAIEAAAGFWDASQTSPRDRLTQSYPKLVEILNAASGPELVEVVAEQLKGLTAATAKFLNFCMEFAPQPPDERPSFSLFDFESKNYKKALKKIYDYRSRALHGGTPFPAPMCGVPRSYEETGFFEEVPGGLASSARGATWLADDLPMLLHMFEYIVRGSLLNWWEALPTEVR